MENSLSLFISTLTAKFLMGFLQTLDKPRDVAMSSLSALYAIAFVALNSEERKLREILDALGFLNEDHLRKTLSELYTAVDKYERLNWLELILTKPVVQVESGVQRTPHLRQEEWADVVNTIYDKTDSTFRRSSGKKGNELFDVRTNIYLQAAWKTGFYEKNTKEMPFHINAKKKQCTKMMRHTCEKFKYGKNEELEAQILELQLVGGEMSVIFILPDVYKMDAIIDKMAAGYDVMAFVDSLKFVKMDVSVPRFCMLEDLNLDIVLNKLGISLDQAPGVNTFLINNELSVETHTKQLVLTKFEEFETEASVLTRSNSYSLGGYSQDKPRDTPRYKHSRKKKGSTKRHSPASTNPHFIADRPFLYLLSGPGRIILSAGVCTGREYTKKGDTHVTLIGRTRNWFSDFIKRFT